MVDSIWIEEPPNTPEALLTEIWGGMAYLRRPDSHEIVQINQGKGFHSVVMTNEYEMEAPADVLKRLQHFTAMLGWLRYKTCEVFISPLSTGEGHHLERALVAQAYRRTDGESGWNQREERRRRQAKGTYSLPEESEQFKNLMNNGEPISQILRRGLIYRASKKGHEEANGYIDYKILATILGTLARRGLNERDVVARYLWRCTLKCLEKELHDKDWLNPTDNMLKASIRNALNALIEAYNPKGSGSMRLILEKEDAIKPALQKILVENAKDALKVANAFGLSTRERNSAIEHLGIALEFWRTISDANVRICNEVRASIRTMPTSVMQFLFEARVKRYAQHLQSATLAAERTPEGRAVLHSDLDEKIKQEQNFRNRSVDVITKEAYETAAQQTLSANECSPKLKSMLLLPFSAQLEVVGNWKVHGFVRLMNRMAIKRGNHVYADNDIPTDEEIKLGAAVAKVLGRGLSNCSLWGLQSSQPT